MPAGDRRDFEFLGGPYDGEVLPVTEDADGLPEVLEVPHVWEGGKWPTEPPKSDWHSYELDGDVYRYIGEADPDVP